MKTDYVAKKISDGLLKMQKGFASFMNKKTAGFSALTMKVLFIAVCSLFVVLSVWFIADVFLSKQRPAKMNVTHIRIIPLIKEKEETTTVLTAEAYRRLQLFKRYMDSLRMDKHGKRIYDSILLARPGLMDTVAILEKIYLSQTK